MCVCYNHYNKCDSFYGYWMCPNGPEVEKHRHWTNFENALCKAANIATHGFLIKSNHGQRSNEYNECRNMKINTYICTYIYK